MKNPPLEEVEKAILESSTQSPQTCLTYLRDRLNELGYKFPETRNGEKKAYGKAVKLWWKIREEESPLESIEIPDELDTLPGTKVSIDDKNYIIHGIFHGQLKQSKSIKEHLQKNFHKYNSRDSGVACVMEDGFSEGMGVTPWTNFGDWKVTDSIHSKGLFTMLGLSLYNLAALPFSNTARTIRKTRKEAEKDVRYLPKYREACNRVVLPEPLFMNYLSDYQILSKIFTERSSFMANRLKKFGNESLRYGFKKEFHAIVGMGHEPQITYFLTNSNDE